MVVTGPTAVGTGGKRSMQLALKFLDADSDVSRELDARELCAFLAADGIGIVCTEAQAAAALKSIDGSGDGKVGGIDLGCRLSALSAPNSAWLAPVH